MKLASFTERIRDQTGHAIIRRERKRTERESGLCVPKTRNRRHLTSHNGPVTSKRPASGASSGLRKQKQKGSHGKLCSRLPRQKGSQAAGKENGLSKPRAGPYQYQVCALIASVVLDSAAPPGAGQPGGLELAKQTRQRNRLGLLPRWKKLVLCLILPVLSGSLG